jgi:hypothetical protein
VSGLTRGSGASASDVTEGSVCPPTLCPVAMPRAAVEPADLLIDSATVDPFAVLLVVGGLVLLAVLWLVAGLAGEAAADEAREAVFRRPGFRERRDRSRGWLFAGVVSFALSGMAGLFAAAALTSGQPDLEDHGVVFVAVAGVLIVGGVVLLVVWWRLAGRPRHF